MSTTYTVERVTPETQYSPEMIDYIVAEVPRLAARFGNDVDYRNADYEGMVRDCFFYVCRRNGEISGHLIADLYTHCFDSNIRVLNQISLYAKPDSGRTAWHLFQKFIDIGKREAKYIITMLTDQTNIKPRTLMNMGFEYAETTYRMEVK